MRLLAVLLVIGFILPLIVGPVVAAQNGTPSATPTNNSNTTDRTDFSIADVANESGTNYTDPSDVANNTSMNYADPSAVANNTSTNYTDPRDVANQTGRNYTDPEDLREGPGSLFTSRKQEKNKRGNNKTDGTWSKNTQVDLNCRDDWFNPQAYACKARQGIINTIYDGALNIMQAAMEAVMGFIFMTPAPQANGGPAILEQPTNWPWKTIYTDWYSYARGVGVLMWILIVLSTLVIRTYTPVGVMTDYQLRGLWTRLILILPLILFSFTLLSLFLNFIDGVIHAVRPGGELAAATMSAFFAQLGSVGVAIVLTWFFQAIVFLFLFFLLWIRLFFIYLFAVAFPIMLPLAIIDVGPLSYIAERMRGYLNDFVTIALLPLPMAASITAGLLLVLALERVTNTGMAFFQAIQTSPLTGLGYMAGKETLQIIGGAFIMLSSWFVAALSPILLWRNSTAMHGMMGRFMSKNLDRDEIDEKVQQAKDNVDVDHRGGAYRSDSYLEGSKYQREANFASRFGGALDSSWIARPSADGPAGQLEGVNLPTGASSQSLGDVSDTHEHTSRTKPSALTAGPRDSATGSFDDDPTSGWRDTARRYAETMFGGLFGGRFGRGDQRGPDAEADTESESATGRHTWSSSAADNKSTTGPRRHSTAPASPKVEKAKKRDTEVTEITTEDELADTEFNVGYIDETGKFRGRESEEHKNISKQRLLNGYYETVVRNIENRSSKDFLGIIRDPETDELYSLDMLIEKQNKEAFEQSVKRAHETFDDLDRKERARWDDES